MILLRRSAGERTAARYGWQLCETIASADGDFDSRIAKMRTRRIPAGYTALGPPPSGSEYSNLMVYAGRRAARTRSDRPAERERRASPRRREESVPGGRTVARMDLEGCGVRPVLLSWPAARQARRRALSLAPFWRVPNDA